VIDKQIEVVNE